MLNLNVTTTKQPSYFHGEISPGSEKLVHQFDYIQFFNQLIQQFANEELSLAQFMTDFGPSLFEAVSEQNRPVFQGQTDLISEAALNKLTRPLFQKQQEVVQACVQLLKYENKPAAIVNAEMGSGKTIMAIGVAIAMAAHGLHRCLVLSPPHLVYKWRREILKTVPEARVWILNGADTLAKLIRIKEMQHKPSVPEFFILGRVRMRMGFNWRPAFTIRKKHYSERDSGLLVTGTEELACCPKCGAVIQDDEGHPYSVDAAYMTLKNERLFCKGQSLFKGNNAKVCKEPLWTLCRKSGSSEHLSVYDRVLKSIQQLPSIGIKKSQMLVDLYGPEYLAEILENNVQAFSNLMDHQGDLVFSDRQASRLDRALSKVEFSFGQGGYQASEFIKRYLPKNYFGLMVIDEGHEYKNYGSAQGQAMGVLARAVNKKLALTGTLMGGYADDLFYLLWRLFPQIMLEDGFNYNKQNTLGSASMAFMKEHGVLKEITRTKGEIGSEYVDGSFTSSRASRNQVRTVKAPGFSPLGIMRYVLPITVFLKLKELGEGILPPYQEYFREIHMSDEQRVIYDDMEKVLTTYLREALRKRDNTLTGIVLNALLAWPDCCFTEQSVIWKRKGEELYFTAPVFEELEASPKEQDMITVIKDNLVEGRKSLVFTTYTDTRDTAARLKGLLEQEGIKVAILRASVKADQREDWLIDRVEEGCQVVITNPELVKTGLDMLEFPTIYFMQTGWNVYTLMQAARRSWRIGQQHDVRVYFGGYMNTAQQVCLELMSKKIAVAQSTSGDMPDTGLDILNQAEDSVEVALAKRLVKQS